LYLYYAYNSIFFYNYVAYLFSVVALGWPQVAFALIGGFLSRRFKITVTPR
jgi:hypothetical protein